MRRVTLIALSALVLSLTGVAVAADGPEAVATGLDNPRHMILGTNGDLYIAEAGTGGDGPCFDGPEGEACFGTSGAVSVVRNRQQSRLIDGLPSLADADGGSASGPHSVAIKGRSEILVSVGLGADPTVTEPGEIFGQTGLGTLMRRHGRTGQVNIVADLGVHESHTNSDGGVLDSNPYGIAAVSRGTYLTDAGANTLVRVDRNGTVTTIASFAPTPAPPPFPPFPVDAVPTDVEIGPDGKIYVSQLTGFPFTPGAANVFEVSLDGTVTVVEDGFTNVVDIAFGPDGSLYVVEIASAGLLAGPFGSVIKVAPDGTRTVVADNLFAPGGVAVNSSGVYVSVNSVLAGVGEVWLYSD